MVQTLRSQYKQGSRSYEEPIQGTRSRSEQQCDVNNTSKVYLKQYVTYKRDINSRTYWTNANHCTAINECTHLKS